MDLISLDLAKGNTMSHWTYVSGIVEVRPIGNTQPQKRYILDTVLEHLPVVSGSEGNMKVHVVQQYGHDCSSAGR